ncbi:MAG: TonB-dependent receptor [Pseudomonadota bacterium]
MAWHPLSSYAGATIEVLPLEEIVVTATRRPVDTATIAQAMTVVEPGERPSEMLLTESLANSVGVFVQQTTPGQGAPIIRGLRGSAVLHLVDGMRLNNAIFRSAPTQYLALVPTGAVERLEVVRGSGASLYGTDAVAGVVNVISKRPEFSDALFRSVGEVDLRLDTAAETRGTELAWNFEGEKLSTRFGGEYHESGDRRIGGGGRVSPSDYRAWGGHAAVRGQHGDVWEWQADVQFMTQPETPRVDELVVGFGQSEPASSEFLFAPNRRAFSHVRAQRKSGWLGATWRVDVAWQHIDDDRRTRDFESPVRVIERNASELFGLSLVADGVAGVFEWVAGIDHYDDHVSSSRREQLLDTGASTVVTPRFPDGSRVRQTSIFGHANWSASDRWHWGSGVRFSAARSDLASAGDIPASRNSVNDVGLDVSLRFDWTERLAVTANLGAGFRAPNVFDLGTLGARPGNRFNIPNADLESERVQQADVGLRFANDRTRWQAVLFFLHYDDRITSVETGQQTPEGRDIVQSANAATSNLQGLEFGFEHAFGARWGVRAVINATRGEQRERGLDNEPGDRIPPVNGLLALTYADDDFSAAVSARSAAAQTRLSARDVRDVRIDPNGTAGWVRIDLDGSWFDIGGWDVHAGVNNLLDRRYRNHGSGIDALGRNLYVSVGRQF